jgi:PAS domain S-box-containing protein
MVLVGRLLAQPTVPAAPAGRVETGAPAFAVFSSEAIGVSALPTDIHLLPDGRVLLLAGNEIAFGDGVRWETFRAAEGQPLVYRHAMVDHDGSIYFGLDGAIGRLELGIDGLWRASPVAAMPEGPQLRHKTMTSAAEAGDEWYWFDGSGEMINWRPGRPMRIVPNTATVETVFHLGTDLYLSDQSSGGLYCLTRGGERVKALEQLTSELITAAVGYDANTVIVGTNLSGLLRFDGSTFTKFGQAGPLTRANRINALCAVGSDFFAAAVDTYGIVFFDRDGKVVQVLDSRLDHRLARVEKLRYSLRDRTLWALLSEGVVRVEFPAPLSNFDPFIATGLTYVSPYRHDGNLWLLADGRVLRGSYNSAGHLERFLLDQPPGKFVFTIADVDGRLYAGNDNGIFVREEKSWRSIGPGIVNARIGVAKTPSGDLVYVARGEIGTLHREGNTYTANRIPHPDLGDNYNARTDRDGITWLELGSGRVARLDPRGTPPVLKAYDRSNGLFDGWVAISNFDGVARFHLPNHVLRFNEATGHFVEDTALLARFPQFNAISSRPELNVDGKLWYSYRGHVWTLDAQTPGAVPEVMPVPFSPYEYKFEQDGVVWLTGSRRIQRYDIHARTYGITQPRVVLTSVQFPNSNRQLFDLRSLAPIPYSDNTLVFHFAAPGNSIAVRSRFEVQMEGVSEGWVPTGNTGHAMFNRLKEGDYTFHVRAVSANGEISREATVTFVIRPPWFRSPIAWAGYLVGGIGLLVLVTWYPAFRQRRENERLEHLVAKRTEELNTINQQLGRQIEETTEKSAALAISEERYRTLSTELEQRVVARTTELSNSNRELQQRESLFRLIFEHAPVGISWKRADLDNLHHFNDTYRRILDLPGTTLSDYRVLAQLIHPDDAPQQHVWDERIAKGETDSFRLEERFVLKDDRVVWGSLCVAVVRDEEGRIVQEIGILEDITARKEAEKQLAATYKELVDTSRMAGMAEVATGVLHNVGNVLNSLNVSSNLIATNARQSRADSLVKLSKLLHERGANLADFLTSDPKGRLVPELLAKLAETATAERDWLLREISSMQDNIDHIKEIVAMQQSYATVVGVTETLPPEALFEDALRMNSVALSRHDVHVVKKFSPVPPVCVEKGKVLQILVNIIRNAKYACDDGQQYGEREKIITVRLELTPDDRVQFIVQDNGVGIAPENLTRIFAHGFTTRSYGHGFGLHSSALAAREMKGSLVATSEGLGRGATFVLEIPAAGSPTRPTGNTPSPLAAKSAS